VPSPTELHTILERLLAGTAVDADRRTLKQALLAGEIIGATGARTVAIGGSATDSILITGDNNVVLSCTGADTSAVQTALTSLLRELPPSSNTRQQEWLHNRRIMIDRVRYFWVQSVLQPSLNNRALIELGLEERPDAVDHPWDSVLQLPDPFGRMLALGTSITDVFTAMVVARMS
jgi:hypothetical protein